MPRQSRTRDRWHGPGCILREGFKLFIKIFSKLTFLFQNAIVSVLRLHFLIEVSKHREDTTWYSGPVAYWSALEINLAIVCATTPALKPLVVRLLPNFGSRFGSKQTGNTSGQVPTIGTQSVRNNANFMRLKGMPSRSSMGDDIRLEPGVGTVIDPGRDHWKEIHVTRDIEQRSLNDDRLSDHSPGSYTRFPKPTGPLHSSH